MLSIIICSISSENLKCLEENIHQTVGIEYEIIAINNREKKWPIARVYNYGAQQAKYPNLFFVHEDVRFHSDNWGSLIIQKLAEPDCGIIGFAGSKMKLVCYGGWYELHEAMVAYLYQGSNKGSYTSFVVAGAYLNRPFEEVITVDGLGLFVRKHIWEKYPFDEELLTGFHCYDIDFSLQIACASYKNYICCSNQVLIEHFSMGSFYGKDWFSATIRLHDKWRHLLPMKTMDFVVLEEQIRLYEEKSSYRFLKKLLKSECSRWEKMKVLKEFWRYPFSWKHLRECISASFKYIRYA